MSGATKRQGESPLLRWLPHRHRWEQSKVNRWGICFERMCRKCGAVQHTRIDDFNWDTCTTTWREGSHP